jgi:hypothetical protein
MILEGLVTTLDANDAMHLAPMGPHVEGPTFMRFELRPFPSSQTFRNLQRHGEGVLHVTDDVLLLARAAIGSAADASWRAATVVRGCVLADCCRYFEFRVQSLDETHDRVRIAAKVVHAERQRDFFGFNRAKHAVVEAAILASRTAILPLDHIAAEFVRLRVLVGKTGGPAEHEAMNLLERFVADLTHGKSPSIDR